MSKNHKIYVNGVLFTSEMEDHVTYSYQNGSQKGKSYTKKSNVKAVNAIIDDDIVDNLPQEGEGEKNTVWPED